MAKPKKNPRTGRKPNGAPPADDAKNVPSKKAKAKPQTKHERDLAEVGNLVSIMALMKLPLDDASLALTRQSVPGVKQLDEAEISNHKTYMLLRLKTLDGGSRDVVLPTAELLINSKVGELLATQEARAAQLKPSALKSFFSGPSTDVPHIMLTRKQGWQNGVYVAKGRVFGADQPILYDEDQKLKVKPFQVRGTLEEWQQNVAEPIRTCPELLFALFVGWAALLIPMAKVPLVSVLYLGESGATKSIALYLVESATSWPDPDNPHPPKWGDTFAAREELKRLMQHNAFTFDELRTAGKTWEDHRDALVEQSYGGGSKKRSVRFEDEQPTFNGAIVTTYETEKGQPPFDMPMGAAVRYIQLRMTEKTIQPPEGVPASEFVPQLEKSAQQYSGAAAEHLVETVSRDYPRWAEYFRKREDWFLTNLRKQRDPDRHGMRMAKGIAAAYAAGRIAKKVGVLPAGWDRKEIFKACLHVFDLAASEMGAASPQAKVD